jgi:alanyl-tRNA synthetase
MDEIQALRSEIEVLKLQNSFLSPKYELAIQQNKETYDLHVAQLNTNLLDKDKEIQKLKIELLSSMAEIDKLKTEVSSVKSVTLQTDASQKEKEDVHKLVEKLVTWDYKKLIIRAEDIVEEIFLIVHTNAFESSYLDLQTQVEVLQRKVKTQKETIKCLKQSQVTKDVLVVGTKTEQITEHTSKSKSTVTLCYVNPPPFTVVCK